MLPITPPAFVFTLYYKMHDQGWSNTFYSSEATYANVATVMNNVNTALLTGMSNYAEIVWGRVSKTDVPFDALIYSKPQFSQTNGSVTEEPLEAASAILMKYYDAEGKWSNMYQHGVPKTFLLDSGSVNTGDADFTTWMTAMGSVLDSIKLPTTKGAAPGTRVLYQPINVNPIRILSHKVGRPFGVSRGRAA